MFNNTWERECEYGTGQVSDGAARLAREAYVFGSGASCGLTQEIRNHPRECEVKAGTSILAGLAIGALAAAELPALTLVTVGTAAVLCGKFAWHLLDPHSHHNRIRNQALRDAAFDAWRYDAATDAWRYDATVDAWRYGDQLRLQNDINRLSDTCGSDSFDIVSGIAGGATAAAGAEFTIGVKGFPVLPVPCTEPIALSGSCARISSDILPEARELLSSCADFMRPAKVHSRPLNPRERVQDVGGDWSAARKEDSLTLKETDDSVIVKDSKGNALIENKQTGDVDDVRVDRALPQPHGDEGFSQGAQRPLYWQKDKR